MYIFCWRKNHLQRQFWGHCDSWIVIYDRRNPFISLRPGKGTFWIGTGGTKRITITIPISATRLGDFWNFFSTKFIAKEAQMIGNFLGYFQKTTLITTELAAFRAIFWGKNLLIAPVSGHTGPNICLHVEPPFPASKNYFRHPKTKIKFTFSMIAANHQSTTNNWTTTMETKIETNFFELGIGGEMLKTFLICVHQ